MNMAIDRTVLRAHEAGEAPPTLRLYRWRVPTVSIGRFQSASDADTTLCQDRGIAVVRRPTGGRGVLHDDELTYSVVAGVAEGLPRGVVASYRVLCGALVAAYRAMGVDAALTARARGDRGASACYLHATNADLSLGAAKLSGSAQVWDGASCLQHGSFVRRRDVDLEAQVFCLDEGARQALKRQAATLSDALGVPPSMGTIARHVVAGFENTFGIVFEAGTLSYKELEDARTSCASYRVEEPKEDGKSCHGDAQQ